MKNVLLLSMLLFGIARSSQIDNEANPSEDSLKRGLTNKCVARETSSCIAIELVGYVDRMLRTASVQLSDDIMIVDESHGAATEIPVKPNSLARAGTSLEDQAQQLIMDKLWNFATSRSLRYRLLDNADLVVAGKKEKDGSFGVGVSLKSPEVIESGRGRNKNIGPFIVAAAMKFGLFAALTYKFLALLVGKALLIAKVSLLLSVIIGLKKLVSSQKRNVIYEVFTDPLLYRDWDEWRRLQQDLAHRSETHLYLHGV